MDQLHFLRDKKNILGFYSHNRTLANGSIEKVAVTNPKMGRFLPIWNVFKIEARAEYEVLDTHTGDSVRSNNESMTRKNASSSQFNLGAADLLTGTATLVFNFSNNTITTRGRDGVARVHPPITFKNVNQYAAAFTNGGSGLTDEIQETYTGSILFVTITTLPSLSTVIDFDPSKEVVDHVELISSNGYKGITPEVKNMYDFVSANRMQGNVDILKESSNSLRVAQLLEIKNDVWFKSEGKDLYLDDLEMVVSPRGIMEISNNPSSNVTGVSDRMAALIEDKGAAFIYIQDKDNQLGPKYVNVLGKTIRIPVIPTDRPGIVMYIKRPSGIVETMTKEDIDSSDFIYSTEEEATRNLNKIEYLTQQLEERKIESNIKTTELQLEGTENKHIFDMEKLKAEMHKEFSKLVTEVTKNNLATEREEASTVREVNKSNTEAISLFQDLRADMYKQHNSLESMRAKSYYDERKYSRDSTIEMLKTGAAIAGTIATGLLLWQKFAK